MAQITIVYAHPYPRRSIAGKALVEAASKLEGVDVRPIYTLYPDFDIDVGAERAALERAKLVVFLHPIYWYSVPGMLKHYFDVVLTKGWAYGEGGGALSDKECLWAVTTGGDDDAYSAKGRHHHPFEHFKAPVEETMRYCGLRWLDPFVVHGSHECGPAALADAAVRFHRHLQDWQAKA